MNIIEAIKDQNLFRPYLERENRDLGLESWEQWIVALRGLYGLGFMRKDQEAFFTQCTGRDPKLIPAGGYQQALFLVGRRSGKSKIVAAIAAYEAALAGNEKKLSVGETGIVAICSPTRSQSQYVKNYLRAIFEGPLLSREVVGETTEGFQLRNGISIQVLTGDPRTVRGATAVAVVIDEAAHFQTDDVKQRSDMELVAALRPALATTNGKLIAVTTPFARRGWVYKTWENNYGNNTGNVLVWRCASRVMNNATLSEEFVQQALAEDYHKNRAEYLAEWRDDVESYLSREVVDSLVAKGRFQLPFDGKLRYQAFADVSGGRSDDSALAIAHRDDSGKVILDLLRRWPSPHDPYLAIAEMAEILRSYRLRHITGDNYAADFVCRSFQSAGITYFKSEKNRSQLYLELMPVACSGGIELLDNERLVSQLASLERRTRVGGRDSVDHPSGGHDDLANAVAGVAVLATQRPLIAGALPPSTSQVESGTRSPHFYQREIKDVHGNTIGRF